MTASRTPFPAPAQPGPSRTTKAGPLVPPFARTTQVTHATNPIVTRAGTRLARGRPAQPSTGQADPAGPDLLRIHSDLPAGIHHRRGPGRNGAVPGLQPGHSVLIPAWIGGSSGLTRRQQPQPNQKPAGRRSPHDQQVSCLQAREDLTAAGSGVSIRLVSPGTWDCVTSDQDGRRLGRRLADTHHHGSLQGELAWLGRALRRACWVSRPGRPACRRCSRGAGHGHAETAERVQGRARAAGDRPALSFLT